MKQPGGGRNDEIECRRGCRGRLLGGKGLAALGWHGGDSVDPADCRASLTCLSGSSFGLHNRGVCGGASVQQGFGIR